MFENQYETRPSDSTRQHTKRIDFDTRTFVLAGTGSAYIALPFRDTLHFLYIDFAAYREPSSQLCLGLFLYSTDMRTLVTAQSGITVYVAW